MFFFPWESLCRVQPVNEIVPVRGESLTLNNLSATTTTLTVTTTTKQWRQPIRHCCCRSGSAHQSTSLVHNYRHVTQSSSVNNRCLVALQINTSHVTPIEDSNKAAAIPSIALAMVILTSRSTFTSDPEVYYELSGGRLGRLPMFMRGRERVSSALLKTSARL